MRIAHFVITAAVLGGLPSTALAQASQAPAGSGPETEGHWYASAYLGSNFGGPSANVQTNLNLPNVESGSSASINFGGEVGYVWSGAYGAEFMTNYSPNFAIGNALLAHNPSVATYMANAIAAVPIRIGDTRFRPFVSGGIGSVRLRSTIFVLEPSATTPSGAALGTTDTGGSRFGWDLGGGLMIFNGAWGLRGDVRYFRASTNDNPTDNTVAGLFLQQSLSGLSFWNANFGVAFRW